MCCDIRQIAREFDGQCFHQTQKGVSFGIPRPGGCKAGGWDPGTLFIYPLHP